MKKLSLFLLMTMALAVTSMAQELPIPANPVLDEWVDYTGGFSQIGFTIIEDFNGDPVANDYTVMAEFMGGEWTKLDPEKLTYRIYTDNDQLFVFTPEEFPRDFTEATTEIPYRYDGFEIGPVEVHFPQHSNVTEGQERFFNWRIGIQTVYRDGGQMTCSDIMYMEIFPQLKPAADVTSTSFLADWSCDAANTGIINNFYGDGCGYFLYVINKETQDTVLVQNVAPTNTAEDEWGNEYALPGATYQVEGLTPGVTYQYYVIVKQNTGASYQSVVREVTLPYHDVYILGEVNDHSWAPNVGEPMAYDAENNVYTATVTLDGRNSGFNYFSFTTEIAQYDDQGSWDYIAPYRFGAVSNGNFEYNDEMNGRPLALTYDNGQAYMVAAGEYKLTVSLENMTLVIEKIPAPVTHKPGDVNHDGVVDVDDVSMIINHVLGKSDEVCTICADVIGDSAIDVDDVSLVINMVLGKN